MAKRKIICDTDVMIDYWKPANDRHLATKKIIEQEIGLKNVVISTITKMELIIGAINKSDLTKINKNLDAFLISSINDEITSTASAFT